jgi:peptidoglycan hydrolase-like protein with peptidoglycan-binding domain
MCCSSRSGGPTGPDPCNLTDLDPPEPVLWLADDWLSKVRTGTELLAVGAKDKSPSGPVELLQRALRYWGCREKRSPQRLLPVYGIDGSYENETRDAVIVFQQENRGANGVPLLADGMVGPVTMAALDRLVLPPVRPPKADMLAVTIDVVIFPDGIKAGWLPRFVEEANYVFNRAGIRIDLGTVWGPHITGPAACRIFEKNRGHSSRGWCRSAVQRETIVQLATPELLRLAAFRPGPRNRITVYHVAEFPPNTGTSWGFTSLPHETTFFSVLIANWNSDDPRDTWWHELGHCLLNTAPGEVVDGKRGDHSHAFMGIPSTPGKAGLPISPAVVRRMQQTALLDLA